MDIMHYNDEEKHLHQYLAELGHDNTIIAADADPFEYAINQPFDAAYIGLHPHGLELIRLLHRRNRECLVTIVTADINARSAAEAMQLGAFDYLFTPLEKHDIERTVLMMTREYQNQRERHNLAGHIDNFDLTTSLDANDSPPTTLRDIVAAVERRAIERALTQHNGNIARAARQLNISRTTLYSKMQPPNP